MKQELLEVDEKGLHTEDGRRVTARPVGLPQLFITESRSPEFKSLEDIGFSGTPKHIYSEEADAYTINVSDQVLRQGDIYHHLSAIQFYKKE